MWRSARIAAKDLYAFGGFCNRRQSARVTRRRAAVAILLPFSGESFGRREPNAAVSRCPLGWPRRGAWRSLVSALVWGTRGPEFESRRPDHLDEPKPSH
jgi:hypothetical protein